jgi:hypothetical protein
MKDSVRFRLEMERETKREQWFTKGDGERKREGR